MTTEHDIDELLRQDEAQLKAKRKRLRTFATTLDELRRATDAAASAAEELTTAGDLSRAELGRIFKLNKNERATLTTPRRPTTTEPTDVPAEEQHQPPHND